MNTRKYINDTRGITVGFGALLWVILSTASCAVSKQTAPAPDSLTEGQAIEKTLTGIIEAANAGEIEAVMAYFAEDAVAMPSGEMPVFGTRLIRPRLQPLFDQSKLVVFLTSEETAASGNFAFARGYMSGRIEPTVSAPTRYIENEYLIILQKDSGGSWKIARLMWHPMWPTGFQISR